MKREIPVETDFLFVCGQNLALNFVIRGEKRSLNSAGAPMLSGWRIIVLVYLYVLLFASSLFAQTLTVKVQRGNVRSGPGLTHSVIGQVNKGEKYTIEGREGAWFKILLEDKRKGWIFHKLVEVAGGKAKKTVPDIARRHSRSVVLIYGQDEYEKTISRGTGFFIQANGQLVTNLHVVKEAKKVLVRLFDGQTLNVRGVLAEIASADLVLLAVDTQGRPVEPLPLARPGSAVPGQRIVVIGSPLGLQGSVSDGLVSAVRQVSGYGKLLQITAPISPGSSGSPVLNLHGEVVGLATLFIKGGQNINFAISVEKLLLLRLMGRYFKKLRRFPITSAQSTSAMYGELRQLRAARDELTGLMQACFSLGYRREAQYSIMTNRDAYLKADQLIYTHEGSADSLTKCQTRAIRKTGAYRTAINKLKKLLKGHGEINPKVAQKVSKLLDRSVEILSLYIKKVFPRAVRLNRMYANYFRQLKATKTLDPSQLLSLPNDIEELENQLIRDAREYISAHAAMIEAFYLIAPTETLRARLQVAKILMRVYRAIEGLAGEDKRDFWKKLRDFRQEWEVAEFMVSQEINNRSLQRRWPNAVTKYKELLGEMKYVNEVYSTMEKLEGVDFSRFSEEKRMSLYSLLRKAVQRLETAVIRVEELAIEIEKEVSSGTRSHSK
ncbi:MAG: trypsin-like peptidase domain-containing protein [Candidatus Binatia bacterium]